MSISLGIRFVGCAFWRSAITIHRHGHEFLRFSRAFLVFLGS